MSASRLPVDPIAEARRQWVDHGWTDAAVGMSAVTSIIRAQQLLMQRVDRVLRPFDLSFARFELLRLLAFTREGVLPTSSAVRRLQVHSTSVTSTVARLERDGLVERERHPEDGRALLLRISPTGRELVDRATDALNAEVFVDVGLPDADTLDLVRLLARLRQGAGDFADPPVVPEPF